MGRSTAISTALHSAILFFVLVAFPPAKIDPAPLIAIPVDLASPSEVTKIKAGSKDAKDDAPLTGKPKEKKPEAVKEAKAEPRAEPAPAPKTETPKETPKQAAKKPDRKPAKPKQASAPKKPAASAKKPMSETDRIAALPNKVPDAANTPTPVLASEEAPSKVRGQSNGSEAAMSVNEIDALRARIAQCWSPPPGGLGAEQIVVKLRLKLNEDGTLVGY